MNRYIILACIFLAACSRPNPAVDDVAPDTPYTGPEEKFYKKEFVFPPVPYAQ